MLHKSNKNLTEDEDITEVMTRFIEKEIKVNNM